MLKLKKNEIKIRSLFWLLIILSLISPPFVFAEAIYFGRELRFFLILNILILISLQNIKLSQTDLLFFVLLISILFVEIIIQRSDLNNIISFYSVILITFLLFKVLSKNKIKTDIFFKNWLHFSFILSSAAIISFLIHQFTNINLDILNFKSSGNFNPMYNYNFSIFGFTIPKNFTFGQLTRVASFFKEPQYAGIFFSLNLILSKKISNSISNKYFITNFLAGILTFSTTFYLVFVILMFPYVRAKLSYFVSALIITSLLLVIVFFLFDKNVDIIELFLSNTSFLDRLERSISGINALQNASLFNLFFGHGINNYSEYNLDRLDRSISSGYLIMLFDFGILLSCLFFLTLITILIKNLTLMLTFLIYLIVFPVFKFYFVWFVVILCILYNSKKLYFDENKTNKQFYNI